MRAGALTVPIRRDNLSEKTGMLEDMLRPW